MGYTVKYGPRVEHMAVRHKTLNEISALTGSTRFFRDSAAGILPPTAPYAHRNAAGIPAGKTPRQNRNGSPQNCSPLCGGRGISASCHAGIPRCPALWLAITTAPCCGKPTTAEATKRCYFLLRDFLLFSRYQQQTKFLWETILKLWMNCWPQGKMQKSKSNSLPASAKFCIQKREPERAVREEKIKSLTQQMKALRHEVYICSDIETDAAEVQEKLRQSRTCRTGRNEMR